MIATIKKERGRNRQMAINLVSILMTFGLSTAISFVLTPYIVSRLGTSAYGFIGLSGTIIGYTSLLTVALNSMAGRFVTLNYHQKKYEEANNYVAAIFYGNAGFAIAIVAIFGVLTIFLDTVLNIPADLVLDVRILFTLLFINSSISLIGGVYSYSTFIKNRLDLSNMRSMSASALRALLTFIAYAFFPPRLWYIGAVGIVTTIYPIAMNYWYFKVLTPELKVRRKNFKMENVILMMKSGAWNILNSLSSILNQGLDLLLANLFISAYYMGILSIIKSIPFLILSLFGSLGVSFHPENIKYYAENNMDMLKASLLKSIRIMGLLSSIPCAIMFAYGDIFFAAWLPNENTNLLYGLSCVTMFGIMFTLPSQSLWYVFTMTDKVKHSSSNLIKYGIINVILILIATNILKSDVAKVFAIVSIQAFLFFVRFNTFLPLYSAKVLGFPKYTFVIPLIRVMLSTAILTFISFVIKCLFAYKYDWFILILVSMATAIIGALCSYWLTLNKNDREFLRTRILHLSR